MTAPAFEKLPSDNPFEDIHRTMDAAQRLGAISLRMIAKGASEQELIDRLKPEPDAVLSVGYPLAHLAAYGFLDAYELTVAAEMRELDKTVAMRTANGTDKPNVFHGGTPSSVQTETIRHMVDHLSHGVLDATEPEYRHKDGRKRISELEAAANIEKALQRIIPHAQRHGVDMELAFPVHSFVGLQQYSMAAAMQRVFPQSFARDHKSAEWLAIDTDSSRSDLGFYDDYAFQRDHGCAAVPLKPEYGHQIWPADSPLEVMEKAFYESVSTDDEAGARAAFNGKTLRASHCLRFANQAGAMPQLLLPLFDATTAFNKQALAGHLMAKNIARYFWLKEGATPDAARDAVVLQAVDGLQKQGGDINHHHAELLMQVAQMNRMDIARELVNRGASIEVAASQAGRITHCDEAGMNVEYPYAEAAKRLNALRRSTPRPRNS